LIQRLWGYYTEPWRKFALLKGRATRPEYWTFTLVNIAIAVLTSLLDLATGLVDSYEDYGPFTLLFLFASLLPSIAVTVRRLHDGNRRGWWILAHGIPLIGWMVWLFQTLAGGTFGENRFGPDPRGRGVVEPPADGGDPYATPKGDRYVRCPWCGQTNPAGRPSCQWCHKPYREQDSPVAPA